MLDKENIKIYLNTPPRTGSHFLLFNIITNLDIDQTSIAKTHTTKYFIKQKTITILRDPKECIISLLSMLRTNRNYPVSFPINKIMEDDASNTSYKSASIIEQIKYYKDFYIKCQESIKDIVPFTFEQVTNSQESCNKVISEYFNIDYRKYPKKYIFDGRKNVLLTSKNAKNYEEINKNISIFDNDFFHIYTEYHKLLSLIEIRQKDLGMI
jgi:hypothetical protein